MRIHIVQKGDTLWKIAQKYGVSFEQLKSMNTHLSNPDNIMPGMKIKVPTTSGSVKKEKPVKEMPITQQPFVQKETPVMPVEQKPVKEQPKEMPKPIIKEVPKPIYMPKPPQPIIPEIDINNYYLLNMQKMNIEQQPVPPVQPVKEMPMPELPQLQEIPKEEPIKEEPVKEEPVAPVQPVQPQMYIQPMPCYPMTPVLPGSGLPCMPMPCHPCGFGHGWWGGHYPVMPLPAMYGQPQMMYPQMGTVGQTGQLMAGYDPTMMGQMQGIDPSMMGQQMSGFDPSAMGQQMQGIDPSMMGQQMPTNLDSSMIGQQMPQEFDAGMMQQQPPENQGSFGQPMGDQSMWQQQQNPMTISPMSDDFDDGNLDNIDYDNDFNDDNMQMPLSPVQGVQDMNPGGQPPMQQWSGQPMFPTMPQQMMSPMMQPHYPMYQQMHHMMPQSDCGCGSKQLIGTYGPEVTQQPSQLHFPDGGYQTPDMWSGQMMPQQGMDMMGGGQMPSSQGMDMWGTQMPQQGMNMMGGGQMPAQGMDMMGGPQMPQSMYGTMPFQGTAPHGQGMDINYPFNQYRPEDDFDDDDE